MNTANLIEKEIIPGLHFAESEVLTSESEIKKRREKLKRATMLGNAYKSKVKIFFKTKDQHVKKVETTTWAVGDEFISLKAGTSIPIHSILDIEF